MSIVLSIFLDNILPIFLLILAGVILGRAFHLDIDTLSKLNLYLFMPAFTFVNLYEAKIPRSLLLVLLFSSLLLIVNLAVSEGLGRKLHFSRPRRKAFQNAISFYNSGNIGLPLVQLVFSTGPAVINGATPYLELATTAQIMVIVLQNLTTATICYYNAASATEKPAAAIRRVFTLPAMYTIALAVILKQIPYDFTQLPVWAAVQYLADGLVAIALVTLGVQLSHTRFNFKLKAAWLAVALRLLGGPLIALPLIKLLGFEGVVAQAVFISSGVPTAVNSALIAAERHNDEDFAAQVVLMSTTLCAVSLILVIYLARVLFPI